MHFHLFVSNPFVVAEINGLGEVPKDIMTVYT